MEEQKLKVHIKATASDDIEDVKSDKPTNLKDFVKANAIEEIQHDQCAGPDGDSSN